jgi:hypothetical protein
MKTTRVTIQNDKIEGLLPAKYALGTYVHVEITTIENGVTTTQSRYGYIASTCITYLYSCYYSGRYVREYGISSDAKMDKIILRVKEDDIIPAQEEEK